MKHETSATALPFGLDHTLVLNLYFRGISHATECKNINDRMQQDWDTKSLMLRTL